MIEVLDKETRTKVKVNMYLTFLFSVVKGIFLTLGQN